MSGRASPVPVRTRTAAGRFAAALLAVLLLGMGVMTFTQGWLSALPSHDHLGIAGDGHIHAHTHHAHPGDDLDRALSRLVNVATPLGFLAPAAGADEARPVISFSPLSGQSDLSSFTAIGAVALAVILALPPRRRLGAVPAARFSAGLAPAPLAPPPRVG